jgi:hypothetical protein
MIRRLLLLVTAAAVVGAVVKTVVPDVSRYLKIRSM